MINLIAFCFEAGEVVGDEVIVETILSFRSAELGVIVKEFKFESIGAAHYLTIILKSCSS